MKQDQFITMVQDIVKNYLEKSGLLRHEWNLGVIDSVNEDSTLNVKINGSNYITPSVPANPDVIFTTGDYVWVHYVNRNPNNIFVPYKRFVRQ